MAREYNARKYFIIEILLSYQARVLLLRDLVMIDLPLFVPPHCEHSPHPCFPSYLRRRIAFVMNNNAFGDSTPHVYFERDGIIYSSPTHSVLPELPPYGMQRRDPRDLLHYWVMYSPQTFCPAAEYLPFLLTHFSNNDPLLGSLYWGGWSGDASVSGPPLYPVLSKGKVVSWTLEESRKVEWGALEDVLMGAINIIWRKGAEVSPEAFTLPLLFHTTIRHPSSTAYWKPFPTHGKALAAISAARDSLLLYAALLSYCIARFELGVPTAPHSWYQHLVDRQLHSVTADCIRSSVVSIFHPSVRRVGTFVSLDQGREFEYFKRICMKAHIPVWFAWPKTLPASMPAWLRAHVPAPHHHIVPSPWTLDMICVGEKGKFAHEEVKQMRNRSICDPSVRSAQRARFSYMVESPHAPNSAIPPATLNEAAVNIEVDADVWIAQREDLYEDLWLTLNRKVQQQIRSRAAESEHINHPNDMTATIWLWEGAGMPIRRSQVTNPERIDALWNDPLQAKSRRYDPYRNEFDFGLPVAGSYALLHNINDGEIDEEEMDHRFVAEYEAGLQDVFNPAQATDMSRIPRMSLVTAEDLQLPFGIRPASWPEIVFDVYGLTMSTLRTNATPQPSAEDWTLVQWAWGVPNLLLETVSPQFWSISGHTQDLNQSDPPLDDIFASPPQDLKFNVRSWCLPNRQDSRVWYIITSKLSGVHPVVVVYDAITAHFCLGIEHLENTSQLKTHLILMGVKFSIGLKLSDVFGGPVPSPALQHEIVTSRRGRLIERLSDYDKIMKRYLGWRAPGAHYSLDDFFEWLSRVCQWCREYPARAQIGLREGGLAWRLLICFVNRKDSASIAAEPAAVAQDMSIAAEDDESNIIADDQLLESERHFLSGVYECYRNG
jgi:hypothetical protein